MTATAPALSTAEGRRTAAERDRGSIMPAARRGDGVGRGGAGRFGRADRLSGGRWRSSSAATRPAGSCLAARFESVGRPPAARHVGASIAAELAVVRLTRGRSGGDRADDRCRGSRPSSRAKWRWASRPTTWEPPRLGWDRLPCRCRGGWACRSSRPIYEIRRAGPSRRRFAWSRPVVWRGALRRDRRLCQREQGNDGGSAATRRAQRGQLCHGPIWWWCWPTTRKRTERTCRQPAGGRRRRGRPDRPGDPAAASRPRAPPPPPIRENFWCNSTAPGRPGKIARRDGGEIARPRRRSGLDRRSRSR